MQSMWFRRVRANPASTATEIHRTLSITLAELDGTEAFTHQLHAYLLHAAARTTATVPTQGIPKRRGLHHMNRYQISTSFPFGFIKRAGINEQKDTMLVYPALAQV